MKRLGGLILILACSMLASPVSFASDGPETAKVCFSDVDYDVTSVCVDYTDVYVFTNDTSDCKCYTNDFGTMPESIFVAASTNWYPNINEWKIYREQLHLKIPTDKCDPANRIRYLS